jgi:peptide/nickel transport system permease protein
VTFFLVHLLPGDPARSIVGIRATPELIAEIRNRLGVDRPLHVQLFGYFRQIIQGDLGQSFVLRVDVRELIFARLPQTLLLVGYAGVLAIVVSIPLALIAAFRQGRFSDQLIRSSLIVALGIPSFWLGVLLVTFLALRTGWFPSGGTGDGFLDTLWHFFLPAFTLAVSFLAVVVRSLRASLLEVLDSDYVALARLKGIRRGRLVTHHLLRNAVKPALTIFGLNMSYLLGTSVIVESVFAINGIGYTLIAAILSRDFLVVQGIALTFGILVIGINLVVDIARLALDPREVS